MLRLQQRADSGYNRLWHQHHLKPKSTRNIHERRSTGSGNARFNIPVAGPRDASQIGYLFLRQSGSPPDITQSFTDFLQEC